jgi:hypothetical protein
MSKRGQVELNETEIKNLVLDCIETKKTWSQIAEHYQISVNKAKTYFKDNKSKYIEERRPIGRIADD